ncbi:MAG TPA: C25 family cysteine peptidase, partial [Candidatus Krumholzibacteria bacterium]|nr:C25 family cysteine peptidase [Candidatus Krumholzibacteria bacterium]
CALALCLVVATGSPRAAASRDASVQREEPGRLVFRVNVPVPRLLESTALAGTERLELDGYNRLGNPGEPPTLTRCFLIGLPGSGAYSVSYRVVSSASLGPHKLEPVATPVGIHDEDLGPGLSDRTVWNEDVFQAYVAPALVTPGDVVYVRHQRVLPIRVTPVSYDPRSQELSVAKQIDVEVHFSSAPTRDSGVSAAPAGGDSRDWEEIYGRLLVNAHQARPWHPATTTFAENLSAGVRVAGGAVKIRVYTTGMHTVSASRAIAAGFPPDQPVANLRVFRRFYTESSLSAGETEIACEVNEDPSGTPGVFDGNDQVVFYARRLRDDPTQGDTREQYSAYNVYWLEPSNGTRMVQRTPPAGFVSADTTSAAFPVTASHFETDTMFQDGTPPGVNDVYYYNWGYEAGPVDMPFTMENIVPGSNVALSALLLNPTYDYARTVRLSVFNSKGETVLNTSYPIPNRSQRGFTATVPASAFDLGTNQFRINRPDASRTSLQVQLNYVEASYSALFRARGNALLFNSASLVGDTTITVTGITSTGVTSTADLRLFDITNPEQPQRILLNAGHFQPVAGGTALAFRESLAGRHNYLLTPASRMTDVAQADLVADSPSTLIGGPAESGVDVLVVSHHDFMAQMQQWAAYRRAQGYRVLLADVDDVFDEFNGGVPNARAVYRFARHFFEHAGAGALVLVGDASEDHKRIHADSGPDFVPTMTRIDDVPQLLQNEVVTTDKKMVKFPGPGGVVDAVPDMIVGRIPAGSPGELDVALAKIYAFEAPGASDFWRKRMIMVADDEFSEGESSFGQVSEYCFHNEGGFQRGEEQAAQIIENSLPAGFNVVRFFLKQYTDNFYPPRTPSDPAPCASRFAAISYVRQNATEKLMNELDQGATLVTIQAHMNRYVITHERLLTGEPGSILNGSTGRDWLRVTNRFKPWIVFAMGCHFSDYAIFREQASDRLLYNAPNGDAFAEQFLFQDERGAVGTYGSSGFEYLDDNADYMNTTAAVWFYEAPYDTLVNQTNAEWKFGEMMFLTEAQMAVMNSRQAAAVERYHILGDPMLRVDAGPPSFQVTVNGKPVQNNEKITSGGEFDTINVVAVVTDENAIHKFSLEVAGVDASDSLTVTPTSDPGLVHARQYRVSFRHRLLPQTYDIVLRAFQAPDTTAGQYHLAAEFRLKVEAYIAVSVNSRAVESGASVPADGDYRVDLGFPVFIPQSDIILTMDDNVITDAQYAHPTPEDSLAWVITFRRKLDAGKHHLRVSARTIEFDYQLVVSESSGLRNVINFPNPFRGDGTRFLYSNDVEIVDGGIDIYTVSGKKVRHLDIPSSARQPGNNGVFWDGRDGSGGELANGVYLYVIKVRQRTGSATFRGTTNKIE